VRTVEQIVEQIRVGAGADFAFVLTRKGRLVTSRAPRDMPEEGRQRLVRAARPLLGTDRIIELTLPREDLVPYGGAAPVDVYLGVVAEQAIICVVMASWADRMRVAPALAKGMEDIEPLLRRGLPTRRASDLGPAKGTPFPADGRPVTMWPPADDHVPPPSVRPSAPPRPFGLPRISSEPEIHVGETELGRMSAVAIRHDVAGVGSFPDITFGETELGRQSLVAIRHERVASASAPEIVVTGEAALGRETMIAIDDDARPRPSSSPDAVRIELVSMPELDVAEPGGRATMPWVEAPADAKRAADAATRARNLAAPKVSIKLDDADATHEDHAPEHGTRVTLAYGAGGPSPKAAKR
jgi:hypothetical protein